MHATNLLLSNLPNLSIKAGTAQDFLNAVGDLVNGKMQFLFHSVCSKVKH